MNGSRPLLVRADQAITLDGPVIDDAVLLVEGDGIAAAGTASELGPGPPGAEVLDLSGLTLLPGLINAHCHLDYTCLRGRLPERESFSKWALAIIQEKRRLKPADYEASVREGLDELLRGGTTTVFEVSASYAAARLAAETPLRVAFFGEVLGLNPFSAGRRMRQYRRAIAAAASGNVILGGMAPHAVYSISKRLMKLIGRELAQRPVPITVHMLESRQEPRINPWFDPRQAVRILDEYGLLDAPLLAVHVNVPTDEDIGKLAADGATVVHCPGSHRFFGHEAFPAEQLREAGVPICLGTDSLASNDRLAVLGELRLFLEAHDEFTVEEAFRMATVVPARFLGMEGRLGVLRRGALADVIGVPTTAATHNATVDEACAAVLKHEGEVPFAMIGGVVARGKKKSWRLRNE